MKETGKKFIRIQGLQRTLGPHWDFPKLIMRIGEIVQSKIKW